MSRCIFILILISSFVVPARAAEIEFIEPPRTISMQEHLYHGWPTLGRLKNGELIAVWSGRREAHVCPFGTVEMMRSRDEGQTWTFPRTLIDSPIDDRDAGVLETSDGSLIVTTFTSLAYDDYYLKKGKFADNPAWLAAHHRLADDAARKAELGEWAIRSTDGGTTWSERIHTIVNSPHGPIQLADGRLLYAGKKLWDKEKRIGVCVSKDDGQSWSWLAEIPTREGDQYANYHELHAVQCDSGKIVVQIRNHNPENKGETLQTESTDGGKTWTEPHSIGVWGLPSFLTRLRDGRLLMSYGHRRPPYGIQARLSSDEGATWSDPLLISTDGAGGDLGYPSSVELQQDGTFLTLWYEKLKESPKAVLRTAKWKLAEAIDIGNRLELFLDDALLAKTEGKVERVVIRPEPKEVVLTCDAPWEGNTSGYFTVLPDEDRIRLYYRGWQHDPETKKQVRSEVTCYAESKDGLAFERPKLNIHEFEGSQSNNIIWKGPGAHNFTPLKDRDGTFRALGSVGGVGKGLLAMESEDGIHWKQSQKDPVITRGAFDSQNLAFWDHQHNEYRAYWRIFTKGVRAIRTATSKDFLNWDNEADLTYPETTPNDHLYTNAIQPYFRAPHIYIGFPTRYLPEEGQRVEPVLMSSRDGVHFHRWQKAVVPEEAPEDRSGNRSNYMAHGMVELPGKPGEISVYATESYYEENPGRLRRFVYRTDGFVALRGTGSATTKAVKTDGSELLVNYVAGKGGSLQIEVLDRSGKVLGKSKKLTGDAIDQVVDWENRPEFGATPFQLRFLLQNADLYSYRFSGLIQSVKKETVRRNRDGNGTTWFHPRACVVPGEGVLMNLQDIGGSDYFGQVHWSATSDLGESWSEPEPISSLGRNPVPGHEDLKAGVCDVTPQYHPQTDTVLALGHVVFYRGPRFSKGDQLKRYPVYTVRKADGTWSERKILEWDDPRGDHIYSNNCGQRVVADNGDIMMAFTFGPTTENRMVAGVRCTFDGETLKIAEVGKPLHNKVGRGLLEPSVTRYQDKFYMTIRAEDDHGYVAESSDGVDYSNKTAWAWDDGTPVKMSTTQQHWLTHSDGLFLVYTRQDESNKNVIRWRSPLWVAQVDTDRLCLIKATEQVVLPLVGDGINDPDGVALMGNFDVTNVTPHESWVTVGEWLPRRDARGNQLLARIRWSRPNRLVAHSKDSLAQASTEEILRPYFSVPAKFKADFGEYPSPRGDKNVDWNTRRQELRQQWMNRLGKWPDLIDSPRVKTLEIRDRESFLQYKIRFDWLPDRPTTGYLLVPKGVSDSPAVLSVYYEPETSAGLNPDAGPHRDFALQLARRGFVTLSIGTTETTRNQTYALYYPNIDKPQMQGLSALSCAAANAWHVLASRSEVDSERIGIVGHSYGGKWAMFAGCLFDRFAAVAVSDPGIVFDSHPSVNYWEPWYLGWHPRPWRKRGVITEENPAHGVYTELRREGRDLHELHALLAPRPFLVSGGAVDPPERWQALNHLVAINKELGYTNRVGMTNRPDHSPNEKSNEVIYAFFDHFLVQR